MMDTEPVKFKLFDSELECLSLERSIYVDGNYAVTANLKWPDGEHEANVISVNLAHGQPFQSKDLSPGEVFFDVNSYDTLHRALLDRGWIELTLNSGQSGHLTYPAVKLTDRAIIVPGQEWQTHLAHLDRKPVDATCNHCKRSHPALTK